MDVWSRTRRTRARNFSMFKPDSAGAWGLPLLTCWMASSTSPWRAVPGHFRLSDLLVELLLPRAVEVRLQPAEQPHQPERLLRHPQHLHLVVRPGLPLRHLHLGDSAVLK